MPRKRPLPEMRIGGALPPAPAHSADDDAHFDAIGRRAAGESFDIKKSKAHTHGTHERPRFRERDQVPVRTTSVHIAADVLTGARMLCVQEGITFSHLVETQLRALIAQRKAG